MACGVTVSYETIRVWVDRFGPQIAAQIRRSRPPAGDKWHLDEMVITIGGHSVESTLNNAKEEQNKTSVGCESLFHENTERVGAIASKRAALHITKTPV